MAITLKQADGATISPADDGKLYNFFAGRDGIITGCQVTFVSGNKLHITSGWGVICGRLFVVTAQDISCSVSSSGTVNGRLRIHVDTSSATPISFVTDASSVLPALATGDINNGATTRDLVLATYSVSTTAISALALPNIALTSGITVSATAPANPKVNDIWVDIS